MGVAAAFTYTGADADADTQQITPPV